MQFNKVWLWGVLGVVLGALVSNVDRFVCRAESEERRAEVPGGDAELRSPIEPSSEPTPSPVVQKPEVEEEKKPEKAEEEAEREPLHILRVVVEKTRVVVVSSELWRIHNCNSRTVSVEPEVENLEIDTNWDGDLILTGDFAAKTTYTLHLKPGIRSNNKELLEPFTTTFYVDEPLMMAPEVSLLSRGEFLPLHRAEIPYEVTNLESLEVELSRAYENNLAPLGTGNWDARSKMTQVAKTSIDVKALERNTPTVRMLNLGELTKGRPGFYRVNLVGRNETLKDGDSVTAEFFLTDLGVVYAYDHAGDFRVAVYRLSDGTPVPGAEVKVISEKGQTQFVGTAGADGLAALTRCAETELSQEEPEALLVTAGEDITYLPLRAFVHHYGKEQDFGEVQPVRAVTWCDRGAVRPGEKVMTYMMARDEALKAVANLTLTCTMANPRGQTQTFTATTDVHGLACFETVVPSESPSGHYRVECKVGQAVVAQGAFYVSDFVADRMQVTVAFAEDEKVTIDAKTYFGTEVDGAKGQVHVTGISQREMPQWKGWSLGMEEAINEALASETVQKIAGKPLVVAYEQPVESAEGPVRIHASATLSEPGGRAVTAHTSKIVYTHEHYVGIREEKGAVQMILLAQKGVTVPPTEAVLTLVRRDWDYQVVREGTNFRYRWEEREVPVTLPMPTVVLSTEAPLTPDFSTLPSGYYTLLAQLDNGSRTAYSFWHAAGEAGKRSANPSVLTFETDKATYLPGDVATLTFSVPAEGTLLLCEGAGELQGMRAQRVGAGNVTVTTQVPLVLTRDTWTLGVTYIADKTEKQSRLFGLAKLPVALEEGYGLKVHLEVPETARPGETANVKLRLTSSDGQPTHGTVMLYAVDEGLLALKNYKTPNPLKQLAATPSCGFNLGDIYGDLYPALRITPDGRIGGDVLMEAAMVGKFASKRNSANGEEDIALSEADIPRIICAPIVVNAAGEAACSVTVPDFQGALRWMAVAANEARMGATDETMVVRSDATLLASTVRFGCPGDKAEVALQLANHNVETGDYELLINGTVIERGTLAKGATKVVYHTTEAATATATLRMGELEVSATLPVHVRPAIPEVKATTFDLLAAGEALPEGAVKLDSTQAVLEPALDWLALYPYRCTEQLSARVLPYVFRDQLTPAEQAMVRSTASHLLARLNSDGDFTIWQGARITTPEASNLAALVLLKAEAQGTLTLDAATRKRLCETLQFRAAALRPEERNMAAFAVWALAEAGERLPPTSARNLLATSQEDSAAFLAAAALVRAGYAGKGAPILRQLLTDGKQREPILADYMDKAAQCALEVAIAIQCGLGAEITEQTLATFFTAPRETTQQNAWTAVALQELGTAIPNGVLIRKTETVSAVRPNQPIQVTRSIVDATGTAVTSLEHGTLAYLRVDIVMPRDCENVAIRDLLPGGLEVEDSALATREEAKLPAWAKKLPNNFHQEYTQNLGRELRRFGTLEKGETTLLVPVRAVTRGTFAIPATTIEAMYEPTLTGAAGGEGVITIH